jgi:hypothetical protein
MRRFRYRIRHRCTGDGGGLVIDQSIGGLDFRGWCAGESGSVLPALAFKRAVGLAIAAAVGKISWRWVGALIGIAAIFSAPIIVNWIKTLFGV